MRNVLFGVVCVDIYTRSGEVRPGCGILHNAYHLQQLGNHPLLLTRLGHDYAALFQDFFARNQIQVLPDGLIEEGACPSIEVALQDSGEAHHLQL